MKRALFFFLVVGCLPGCKSSMFTTASTPHAKYSAGLKKAELDSTAIGKAWFNAAGRSLSQPLNINLPYKETGYFDGMKVSAAGYRFIVRRGERIRVSISKKPVTGFNIFLELWSVKTGSSPSLEEALDIDQVQLDKVINKDGEYIIRIQPELLSSGEYTLVIETGPSLAFPVLEKANPRIGSFWGDRRDAGARSHEGIDIFAPRRTPLIAAISGTVSSVSENNLG